jgi:thiol-disulfide isomerase/thioredoxin
MVHFTQTNLIVPGVVLVFAMVLTACGDDPEPAARTTTAAEPQLPATTTVPPMLGNALALVDIDGWLQSNVSSLEELRGQVVIVQFWTFGCSSCKAVLPDMKQIYADYRIEGLEIVGVHSPEFSYEEDPDAITAASVDLGVTWPIALDTDRRNFHTWQGSPAYWPRTYVLDRNGLIRYDNIGGIVYEEFEQTVVALLAE